MNNSKCMTAKQLMLALQVKERTFYSFKKKYPDLPSFSVNENLRYDFEEVLTFLKKRGVSGEK